MRQSSLSGPTRRRRRRRPGVVLSMASCLSVLLVATTTTAPTSSAQGREYFGNHNNNPPVTSGSGAVAGAALEDDTAADSGTPKHHHHHPRLHLHHQQKQRPSGAAAAATVDDDFASSESESSTIPKVVLRPRTRLKLLEEQQEKLNHAAEPSAPAEQQRRRSPTYPKISSQMAPIPMAHPATAVHHIAISATDRQSPNDHIATATTNMDTANVVNAERHEGNDIVYDMQNPIMGSQDQQELLLQQQQLQEEHDFMNWCKHVLGITTILEIKTFAYDIHSSMQSAAKKNHANWENDIMDDKTVVTDPAAPSEQDSTTTTGTTTDDNDHTHSHQHSTKKNDAAGQHVLVRGLAAARDIAPGETVIRIPLPALLSVATSIDQDPVLSSVMGPTARTRHGWDDAAFFGGATTIDDTIAEDDDAGDDGVEPHFYELPLLAVALLHHRRLGAESPMAPYIRILIRSPVDNMPFLWPAERLQRPTVSEGVRIVARGIRQEIRTMYNRVVVVLIESHPDIFGPPPPATTVTEDGTTTGGGEWMFSFEMFQWAFAIVNSRHWQLPIQDLTTDLLHRHHHHDSDHDDASSPTRSTTTTTALIPDLGDQVPPADTPTDSWVLEHGDVDDDHVSDQRESTKRERRDEEAGKNNNNHASQLTMDHSFLAPVADLLNFGPPCTRVKYSKDSRTFEIIATCPFSKGQEVTFWYSNECDDIMMGVYGFSHPLVPPCKSSEEWRLHADTLEARLQDAYADLKMLETELEYVESILVDCDCCDSTYTTTTTTTNNEKGEGGHQHGHNSRLRHDEPATTTTRRGVTSAPAGRSSNESSRRSRDRTAKNSNKSSSNRENPRIRRTWSRKTEF